MSDVTIMTEDGEGLEGRWDGPAAPDAVVVLCHPHPQHGGTMSVPLIRAVARKLADGGCAVLRFNFRGVGASTGRWEGGEAEIGDVAAAVAEAQLSHPRLPLGIAGWSFGAATALRWQARAGDDSPYVGIAPPVSRESTPVLPDPADLAPARRRFVLGDRDQYVIVDELEGYAADIGADVVVVKGSDHFFHFRDQRVATLVAEGLRG
jgi:alpha/beta superfamily hydrolase